MARLFFVMILAASLVGAVMTDIVAVYPANPVAITAMVGGGKLVVSSTLLSACVGERYGVLELQRFQGGQWTSEKSAYFYFGGEIGVVDLDNAARFAPSEVVVEFPLPPPGVYSVSPRWIHVGPGRCGATSFGQREMALTVVGDPMMVEWPDLGPVSRLFSYKVATGKMVFEVATPHKTRIVVSQPQAGGAVISLDVTVPASGMASLSAATNRFKANLPVKIYVLDVERGISTSTTLPPGWGNTYPFLR